MLVLDDNPRSLAPLRDTLVGAGYEVLSTRVPEELESLAAESQPNLIILDVRMPGMDGFETAAVLAQNPATSTIPFIFVSACSVEDYKQRAKDVGALAFVAKPYKREELLSCVQRILDRKR